MRASELLREEASQRIEAAVRAAEQRTSGEIVPVVVDRSDGYAAVRMVSACALAFAAGLVTLATPLDPLLWLPPIQAAAFGLAYLAGAQRELLRRLIPAQQREQCARRAAGLAFFELGLSSTRDHTGILLYVTLLEHQVVVLADRGIDAHVEPGTWDGVVEHILAGIRSGRAEEGLCEAIARCADLLATRFPPRADDVNELPDRPRS
jgi:putative membrane protein